MQPWVERLLNLQALDLELRGLRLRLSMVPKEKTQIIAKVRELEAGVKAARDNRHEIEMELKSNESETRALNDKIDKLKQQSGLVKKNTEYQAMLDNIEMIKAAISTQETRALELMDAADLQLTAIRKLEKQAAAEITGLKAGFNELDTLVAEIKQRIAELETQRAGRTRGVESGLLEHYELILSKNSGVPVVPMEQDKCGNCHLRLTPQTMTHVKNGDSCFCDNCSHIIYEP